MQQLMLSFDGAYPPQEVLDAVQAGKIGAICLFKHRNVETPAQVRRLTEALQQAARAGGQPPLLIGIDQEGGQLIAIAAGATELPGNMALGATRSTELAAKAGYVLGRELLAMGINLNFAPALDVNINPRNSVIGIRAFGDQPALVGELGAALIQAMQEQGVLAVAKHFPGHGDTSIDPHFGAPVNHHNRQRLETVELAPFRRAIEANVVAIMTAHVTFEALDPEHPATQSALVLNGLLRQEMGFNGLIISDALDMYAASRIGSVAGVRAALEAGVDLALMGHIENQLAIVDELAEQARPDAVNRILAARASLPTTLPPLDVVGCAEHQAIAQEIADRSITLVTDDGRLPLCPTPETKIAVITVQPTDLTPADTSSSVTVTLGKAIRRRHSNVCEINIPYQAPETSIGDALEACRDAGLVVVGTIAASEDESQAALVRALHERGQSPVVVALRTPYDIVAFPMIETYLCAYGVRTVTCEAVAKVLFGEIEARGILPCAIPGIESQDIIA
ncbi:MAG: beta-N-acetylhexosaminidase [Chloroflexota bacterium]